MPETSLCRQNDCPNAYKCYRFTTAPADIWQSYFQPEYHAGPGGVKCDYFISNEGHNKRVNEVKNK